MTRRRRLPTLQGGAALLAVAACLDAAGAEPSAAEQEKAREQRIRALLEQDRTQQDADATAPSYEEAPPPAPRHQGVVVEAAVGALVHAGALREISPPAPRFHLLGGYEPTSWLLVFAEADLTLGRTSRASPPPDPRAYALYGFGAGARLTVPVGDRVGLLLQPSVGAAQVGEDVLSIYGFRDADSWHLYYGGLLGAEWYATNPHYALGAHFGARLHPDGLTHSSVDDPPLVLLAEIAARYAF